MSTYATDVSPILLDIETAPIENARSFIDQPSLDDIKAPSNYVKPEAIASYIEKETAKRLADYETDCASKAALDFNVARVVAIGWWKNGQTSVRYEFDGDSGEAEAIAEFWQLAQHRTIVGFRIREFDLPMLMQRSRYLGIPHPVLDLGRYARGNGITDLFDLLTFNDLRGETIMRRTAKSFARRFGIPVDDAIAGKDIPALVAAGEWDKVSDHVTSDVQLEVALARKLGVIVPAPELAEVL
jgi:hypothetical protein